MILNVIDNRHRKYRWKRIHAVLENTSNDNACADSDQAPASAGDEIVIEERSGLSLTEAIAWGTAWPGALTLYLYDMDDSIDQESETDR